MSTIKFEKGKFYKTRRGHKAECVHTNVGGYGAGPFSVLFVIDGECHFTTDDSGRFSNSLLFNGLDIISEWKDERVVWVVYSGCPSYTFISTKYSEAFRCYTNLGEHPANSITRVVIQDGHVDTE